MLKCNNIDPQYFMRSFKCQKVYIAVDEYAHVLKFNFLYFTILFICRTYVPKF